MIAKASTSPVFTLIPALYPLCLDFNLPLKSRLHSRPQLSPPNPIFSISTNHTFPSSTISLLSVSCSSHNNKFRISQSPQCQNSPECSTDYPLRNFKFRVYTIKQHPEIQMAKKQLDLNAPLLSVRRLSATGPDSDGASSNSGRNPTSFRQQSPWEPEQEVTKPASVPFIWEQSPGQAKNNKTPVSHCPKNPQISHQFPTQIDKQSSQYHNTDEIETLSISISGNYSEGMSEGNGDTESTRSFCSDYQTRDYLLNRFLPAAKTMVIETPQYVVKRQEGGIVEDLKSVKRVYSGELRPLLLGNYPVNGCDDYGNEKGIVVGEDEGKKKKKGKKGFRFFMPRMCTKRSASSCVLDSVAGVKGSGVGDSPGRFPRLSRRSSYSGPLTPSLEKQAMDAVIKKRAESQLKEAHGTQRKSSPLTRTGNSLPSSPHRGLSRSGRISPYRNESPRSPFHDGARFLGVPNDVQNQTIKPKTCPSLNVKSHFSPRLIHDNTPIAPEKTLYIDWMEKPSNVTRNEARIEPNSDHDSTVRVPPLPKSPSESWLWRKMTLRSSFPKKQHPTSEKTHANGPKWESIVKTSNVHNGYVGYSEELLNVSKFTREECEAVLFF